MKELTPDQEVQLQAKAKELTTLREEMVTMGVWPPPADLKIGPDYVFWFGLAGSLLFLFLPLIILLLIG